MSGAGVYWFKIKDSQYAYLGDFEQNKFHGEGKLVSMIGPTVGDVIYLGELKEGIKNGTGAFFYDNSPEHYYLGNWIRD